MAKGWLGVGISGSVLSCREKVATFVSFFGLREISHEVPTGHDF